MPHYPQEYLSKWHGPLEEQQLVVLSEDLLVPCLVEWQVGSHCMHHFAFSILFCVCITVLSVFGCVSVCVCVWICQSVYFVIWGSVFFYVLKKKRGHCGKGLIVYTCICVCVCVCVCVCDGQQERIYLYFSAFLCIVLFVCFFVVGGDGFFWVFFI